MTGRGGPWRRREPGCAARFGIGQAREFAVVAHAAARRAADPAARAAARSAGQAAGTAHLGRHARHAANYAVAAVNHAFPGDGQAGAREQTWQYDRIPEAIRLFAYPESGPS